MILKQISTYEPGSPGALALGSSHDFYYQLEDFKDIYPQITRQLKKIIQNKCEYTSSSLKIREINDRMAFSQSEEMRKRCIEFMKESLEYKASVFVDYY